MQLFRNNTSTNIIIIMLSWVKTVVPPKLDFFKTGECDT